MSSVRRKKGPVMGLMKTAVRIWNLSFLSLHMLHSVSLGQQSTAFLSSQVRRTVREKSPTTLTSIRRAGRDLPG